MDDESPVKPARKKKPKRKYDRYNALDQALRKSGIAGSGKVAGLLLDAFNEKGGIITAADVHERGLCGDKKGDFSNWRQQLIDAGWIKWSYASAKAAGDLSRCFPTEVLVEKYLNPEIAARYQLATTEQLYQGLAAKADRIELEAQKEKTAALEAKIAALEAKSEALEQRLGALEDRESHYLSALRSAAALLLETSDSDAIEAFVKTMLKAAVDAEENAAPVPAQLAN